MSIFMLVALCLMCLLFETTRWLALLGLAVLVYVFPPLLLVLIAAVGLLMFLNHKFS